MAMYCIILYYVMVNFVLFTRVLGNHDGSRIVNGYNANILDHPHMVSLEIDGRLFCGGSLIKPNMVLTAAHCLQMSEAVEKTISVRAGTAVKETGGQTAKVIEICINPKFNTINNTTDIFDYDDGVGKLDRTLVLNGFTKPIKLQPKGVEVLDHRIGTVAGWGALQDAKTNEQYPRILQEMKVYKINHEICRVTSVIHVSPRFTCFGSGILGLKSFCDGDSGSAIVVQGKQVGIVSASQGCGLPLFFPNLYTRIENEEIHNHIDQCIAKFEK